jgi:hypothetical protein
MNDELKGGKEILSNWMKFTAVGDYIKGTLIDRKLQPSSDPTFQDQWVYKVKKADNTVWSVGVSVAKQGTIDRLGNCKIGEIIAIEFESEGKPSKKGFKPAKNLKVYTFGMDENYSELDGGDELEPVQM